MPRLALHWQILIAMVLGSAAGLALNLSAGRRELPGPIPVVAGVMQPYGVAAPVKTQPGTFWASDSPERIAMQIVREQDGSPSARRVLVGLLDEKAAPERPGSRLADAAGWPALPAGVMPTEAIVPDLNALKAADPEAFVLFARYGRSRARVVADGLKLVGDLFLRLLRMVSVPLVVFSITTGVVGIGGGERLGRMFGRTVLYYLSTSTLAISTGLLVFNLIRPGESERVEALPAAAPAEQGQALSTILLEQVEHLIPLNPLQAAVSGDFLGIIAYSLAFAIFAVIVGGKTAQTVRDVAEAGFEVMMRMTMAIIRLAPLGVFCLMLFAVATQGLGVFGHLGWYMLTVACGLAIHGLVTLPLIVRLFARRNPWEFAKAMSPALLTAFSSASGNATLPLTMASAEERAGISNRVTSFMLPLGAAMNMDGTALYEVVAVLFIANMTPGVDLAISQQAVVAFTALLVSIGAAGIPHAGLVMMIVILQAVGLPLESQGMIIAVDRLLDMARTSVNVWSDSCGCAVIARYES
jgi:Na+/H+-dicarboxylate symporter